MRLEGDILWVAGPVEEGSRYDQSILTIRIKFLNNKYIFFQSKGQGHALSKNPGYIICIMTMVTEHIYFLP